MQFSVTYEDGVWVFNVSSSEGEPDYQEEFEITNIADARLAARQLIEEIRDRSENDSDEEDEEEDEAEEEDDDDSYEEDLDIFGRNRS